MTDTVLAIHGGAGAIALNETTQELRAQYESELRTVLLKASAILGQGGTSIDAVSEAVRLLEECPLFNAGHGAVFTSDGTHELDAAIMDGKTLSCGAVANVSTLRNPVLAARAIMEQGDHVLLVGQGAEEFARQCGVESVQPDFFSTKFRRDQLNAVHSGQNKSTMVLDHDAAPLDEETKFGTVGAVALDRYGNLAAATSTGGMTNKRPGRVGDTPLIGAGCYANNRTCAVSATGTGEMFIRTMAAYDVSAQMEYAGCTVREAARNVVFKKLPAIGGAGGLIALDAKGNVTLPFNTQGMYRGVIRIDKQPFVAIHS